MWITPAERERWAQGTYVDSYQRLGAHPDADGTWFTVWAPHAEYVSVIGDFNGWNPEAHPLHRLDGNLWDLHVPGVAAGQRYKYHIRRGHYRADKTDPYAFSMEPPDQDGNPIAGLSSIVTDLSYTWSDAEWMKARPTPTDSMQRPMSIYEVHLGSWRKKADGYSLSYKEIAEPLADHVEQMGFTHVELMPVMEHPYYGSWGYQVVGYYAPTFRYGTPQDLMYLIDYLHQRGIGVLLDWVPAHFATDPQGLVFFDGSTLFEYDDPRMRAHPDWGTYVFDYNKPGVKNFLVSNALFWLDYYHIDGLRFDAVASMLYRDYSRGDNWSPNRYGGRENLEAIDLLKSVNEAAFSRFPSVAMVAEESTAWPGVSAPTYDGGLGFLYKWNMGWMHDTLAYMQQDPIHRKFNHNHLTFPLVYAFSEHYTLPLSHDEVVHGKGSLWGKMPGDDWQKAANLRLLYGHMYGSPGKKLLFMGSEFGQTREWNHDGELDWVLEEAPLHSGVQAWLRDLNALYRDHGALWDDTSTGFRWIDYSDSDQSVISYLRHHDGAELLFLINFTPVVREGYRIGVPRGGQWTEVLNSDADGYGGSGLVYGETLLEAEVEAQHGHDYSLSLRLPPLGMIVLEHVAGTEPPPAPAKEAEDTSDERTTPPLAEAD